MVYELGISLYPNRKNWMTEAFEHFLSGFIFSVGIHRRLSTSLPAWLLSHSKLYFWQATRHYSMAVQFWQVVVNAVNKHTKTDRFVRRLDIPQRLPSNNGKNEALIQQHLIFWYQTQILNDSNVWSSGVCIKHCVSRTCKTVSRCVTSPTSPCFAKKNSGLEAWHLLEF